MTNLLLVAGTRPEAIKMAPILQQLQESKVGFTFVWTGQHYDYEMNRTFFEQLNLPEPDYNLDVRSGTHAQQTAKAMVRLEKILGKSEPSIVVSEGDTNAVAAAAMTSVKCSIPFAHVEAGLRSWNAAMPEEINRRIADSIASLHFAPTKLAALNLLFEGAPRRGLHFTGNTIVDIVQKHKAAAKEIGERITTELNLEKGNYLLVTLHRAENTDNATRLRNILTSLKKLANEFDVVFPAHPRTKRRISRFGLKSLLKRIVWLKPLAYQKFLGLLMNSSVVLTDSGGLQEEACILRVPTVTLRYTTERPETLLYGNVLAGADTQTIVKLVHRQLELAERIKETRLPNLFGDGRAGERIANLLKESVEQGLKISEPDMRRTPFVTYRLFGRHEMTGEKVAERLVGFDRSGSPGLTDKLRTRWLARIKRSYDHSVIE